MNILFITNFFSPENTIAAVRTSKLVKYLVREGNALTVISPVLENYDLIDETLECSEFNQIKRITVPYTNVTTMLTRSYRKGTMKHLATVSIGQQTKSTFKDIFFRKARSWFHKWRDYEWSRKVNKEIQSNNTVYDIVISSSPNVSAHESAYFAKKIGRAKRWIADFRDPIVLESSVGSEREKSVKKQSLIVHRADIVTHVSQAGVENFVCYPKDRNKIVWVPNGFDEEDLNIVNIDKHNILENSKQIVFSYAGGLYKGERDCSPLFKAIRDLVNNKIISMEDVRFDYAGRDSSFLIEQAGRYGMSSIIRDQGLITRDRSILMQQSSDCVVVATFCYTDHGGAMTGKIYEPIMMKKYILLLVSGEGKQSEPGAFVKDLNAGTVYEESENHGDVSVIKQMILKMIEEKKNRGYIEPTINEVQRIKYSYQNIAKELIYRVSKI